MMGLGGNSRTKSVAVLSLEGRHLHFEQIFSRTCWPPCAPGLLDLFVLLIILVHESGL